MRKIGDVTHGLDIDRICAVKNGKRDVALRDFCIFLHLINGLPPPFHVGKNGVRQGKQTGRELKAALGRAPQIMKRDQCLAKP